MQPIPYALLTFIATLCRSRLSMQLEIMALRHQLSVYQRSVRRPRLKADDRLLWSWLSQLWAGWQKVLIFVQPRTVIAWQQKRFRDYWQALTIHQQALGEQHPAAAASLNNLAGLYCAMGDYAQAKPLLRQALTIWQQVLGKQHPETATRLNNLAGLLATTDRFSEAFDLMVQAEAIADRMLGQIFSIGSESQRMAYLQTIRNGFDVFLSLVQQYLNESPVACRAAMDRVLRRKAVGAEALAAQRDAVLAGQYSVLAPKLKELTVLRGQITQKTLAGPGAEDVTAYQQRLAEWQTRKDRLEAELARQIPEMNLEQRLQAADRQAVAKALPVGSTLVEFVRFDVFDFKAVPARGERLYKPAHYLAFVMSSGQPDQITMYDLGEAVFIDRRIAAFRAAAIGQAERRPIAQPLPAASAAPSPKPAGFWARLLHLHTQPKPPQSPPSQTQARDLSAIPASHSIPSHQEGVSLREVLFDPLLPALGDCQQLLLSPDGDLTRLPFEVLPTADGQRLIDEYHISYLASGRDILRFGIKPNREPASPLVAADPDFDLGGSGKTEQSTGRCSRDLNQAGIEFGRLPGTRVEGEHIAELLPVKPWLEGAALEAKLKAHRSPRILHFATHGFFLADQQRDLNKELPSGSGPSGDQVGRFSASRLENPLLRSGLALAGANTWLKGGDLPPEAEDGLLTAEDVTGLDLLNTELVVLSACETGLGETQIGEGVFGLRRAFVLAGARTLVMSLWKVPDQQTQMLMEDFYHRLQAGQPRAEALREAQLALRARYPAPYYWGAFICQGETGPLSAVG